MSLARAKWPGSVDPGLTRAAARRGLTRAAERLSLTRAAKSHSRARLGLARVGRLDWGMVTVHQISAFAWPPRPSGRRAMGVLRGGDDDGPAAAVGRLLLATASCTPVHALHGPAQPIRSAGQLSSSGDAAYMSWVMQHTGVGRRLCTATLLLSLHDYVQSRTLHIVQIFTEASGSE